MPEHIIDCTITKVYEGPDGEGEWGPWQAYNFYLDKGDKKKFGFMWSGKKPKPVKGMKIKHLEYEVEEDGQYTNYKVKTLEVAEQKGDESTPKAIPNAKEDMGTIPESKPDKEVSYWVRYMTDIAVAIISNGGELITADLDVIARKVGKAGLIMMNESLNNGQIPSQDRKGSTVGDKPEPKGKDKPKSTRGKGGPLKVVCDYEEAPFNGKEIITMFCKNQCEFKDKCSTAIQLREAE